MRYIERCIKILNTMFVEMISLSLEKREGKRRRWINNEVHILNYEHISHIFSFYQ